MGGLNILACMSSQPGEDFFMEFTTLRTSFILISGMKILGSI